MIYLDHSATSFPKPRAVERAVSRALMCCANPGRGGYPGAVAADKTVFRCREAAADLFACLPEQVVFTSNCTHGLNMALGTLIKPGSQVVISGFEHNAVTRPLHALGAKITVAARRLFSWEDTLESFEKALKRGVDAAVFTHVSNVFGYILPVEELSRMCREKGIPFIIDAAQSAGILPVSFAALGAEFIAMPGHKGLLGPQGTGILLCAKDVKPLISGGTGSASLEQTMPRELPERGEAGTLNVSGIAGLLAGIECVKERGREAIHRREAALAELCAKELEERGFQVFSGPHQSGVVSFVGNEDCQEIAGRLAKQGVGVRAGLHCAPLAHESANTVKTGTVRASFGYGSTFRELRYFLDVLGRNP